MITINEGTYRSLAALLLQEIADSHFFNGVIEFDTEEFSSSLLCTLIVCRECRSEENPGSSAPAILSILPVWWEYRLWQQEGEQCHDFSWSELSQYLGL